jgi:hypothetical protein
MLLSAPLGMCYGSDEEWMLANMSTVGNSQIGFTQNKNKKTQNILRDADLSQAT